MKRKIHSLEEYREISGDVWAVFKKYFPKDVNTDSFADDVRALDEKYKENPRTYEFMQKLLKVYFQELNELRGLRDGDSMEGRT